MDAGRAVPVKAVMPSAANASKSSGPSSGIPSRMAAMAMSPQGALGGQRAFSI